MENYEHNDIVTVDKMNEAIAESGGGYDAIIRLNRTDLWAVNSGTLESGTFSDMNAKSLAREPLKICVYAYETAVEGYPDTTTFNVIETLHNNYSSDPEDHCIQIAVLGVRNFGIGELVNLHISVNYDDTVTIGNKYRTTMSST